MARIGLVRIDSRLIHGQVCTQWLYRTNSKKVYIVDDEGASNSFLSSIYKMACPVGVELETISTEEAGKRWQQDRLGDLEPIFVLFKNMPMAYKAYKAGFRYATLQVGGIGGGVGRKILSDRFRLMITMQKCWMKCSRMDWRLISSRYRIIKRYPGLM